jgi:hypothetical protein
MIRKRKQMIHESRYAADVEITLIDDETPWAPIVAKEDAIKTDRVRLALRRGDIKAVAKEAKVFELLPLTGERAMGCQYLSIGEMPVVRS